MVFIQFTITIAWHDIYVLMLDSVTILLYTHSRYTSYKTISGIDLNTSDSSQTFIPIERGRTRLWGLDFDSREGFVYWADGPVPQSPSSESRRPFPATRIQGSQDSQASSVSKQCQQYFYYYYYYFVVIALYVIHVVKNLKFGVM